WNVAQTVTVTGVDDAVNDGNINYTIITAPSSSADIQYNNIDAADVSVTNADDDAPGITVVPIGGLITSEAGGTATFQIILNSQPTANVTINLHSSNTAEGTISANSVVFTAANWNVTQTITITGVNDFLDDGNISYTIITDAAISADGTYSGIDASDVSVTNTDDDTASIVVTPASGTTTEAGGTMTFTVSLASQPTDDVFLSV